MDIYWIIEFVFVQLINLSFISGLQSSVVDFFDTAILTPRLAVSIFIIISFAENIF